MKPPNKDAITKALRILLESIQEENKCTFVSSCTHPLETIPFEDLAINVEALGLAKACLGKEVENLTARVQHHRNLAAPIHRLPQEIFGMILEKFVPGRSVDDGHGLLQLLRVCRLWHDSIVDSPLLWTWLGPAVPPKIARLVIERSKDLPILSFYWNTVDGYDDDEEMQEVLEMAIRHSTRFRSMELRVSSEDPAEIWPLLQAPTPVLESLTIEMDEDPDEEEDEFVEFTLSEGAPLKYLVLHDVSLNFDSPRLSGLAILRLYQYAVPTSLDILLQVLSATQWLEELTLGSDASDEEPVAPGPQVTLGHLKELKLEDITNYYCAALLSSIYTPICSRVHVSDVWKEDANPLDSLIWEPRNARTTAVLGLQQKSDAPVSRISILVSSSVVDVHVYGQESNGPRVLSFNRSRPWQLVKLLGDFFSFVPVCPQISLFSSADTSPGDPFDLKPWGAVLHSLHLSCPTACLRALEQLAQFTAPPNASERVTSVSQVEGWTCPNLKYITLHIPGIESERDLHAATLLSLVKTRWSGTDDDPAPANPPAGFEIICTYSGYQKLLDVEIEVKKVVICFGFRWTRG